MDPIKTEIVVVGAGPAGLSCAYFLAKLGFEAVVFEAKQELGGMVGGVIPGYRLNPETLEGDLVRLRQLGVQIRLGQVLGRSKIITRNPIAWAASRQ